MTIFLEKPHEEECSYPLVPISKRVILDDEVEEVCCLLFDGRIEVYSIECRDDRREDTDEALVLLISEEVCGFSLFYEFLPKLADDSMCLTVLDDVGDISTSLDLETACIVLIE